MSSLGSPGTVRSKLIVLRSQSPNSRPAEERARTFKSPSARFRWPSRFRADLMAGAGEVSLKIQKLRWQTFETAIIERYRRRES